MTSKVIVPLSDVTVVSVGAHPRVLYKGFQFTKNMARHNTTHYRCIDRRCSATIVMKSDHCVVNHCHSHNNAKTVNSLLRFQARKIASQNPYVRPSHAFEVASEQVSQLLDSKSVQTFGSKLNFKKALYTSSRPHRTVDSKHSSLELPLDRNSSHSLPSPSSLISPTSASSSSDSFSSLASSPSASSASSSPHSSSLSSPSGFRLANSPPSSSSASSSLSFSIDRILGHGSNSIGFQTSSTSLPRFGSLSLPTPSHSNVNSFGSFGSTFPSSNYSSSDRSLTFNTDPSISAFRSPHSVNFVPSYSQSNSLYFHSRFLHSQF